MSHLDHKATSPASVACFVLTISDTRTDQNDTSGQAIASGIFVLPTLADEWGLVVNEAMASGLPVLGSVYSQAAHELCGDGIEMAPISPVLIHLPCELQIGFICQRGWLQRPPGAVDELAAQTLLELVDEPADGRLRQLVRFRRLGEIAQADQIAENLDRLQLH